MRILQLTKKFPWPVKDGEVVGIINLTMGFSALGNEVTVLALNTKKHHFQLESLPPDIKKAATFMAVDIDTSVKAIPAFFNLFTSRSYNIERFYSKAFEHKIIEVLSGKTYDMVLLEGIYLMRYIDVIRRHTKTKVVLRPQNVEYIIWQRLCDNEKNAIKKAYIRLLASRMKKFELDNINKADVIIPVSEIDDSVFVCNGCVVPHKAIPTGYMLAELPAYNNDEENAVAFIGGLDWLPNKEGVDWFIQHVWPLIIKQIPNAKFYIAGRNFPEEYKQLNVPGIHAIGEVEDAQQFIFSKSISIVPLFAGSGMRVKIIEAMALGRAIVSTTIGAESILYTDKVNIKIADTAETFALAVIEILRNNNLRKDLGANAQALIQQFYDNKVICQSILDFCKPYLS